MSKLKMWRVETRPNTSVEFHQQTNADKAYYKTTYEDTGTLISAEYTMSDDNLQRTRTLWWNIVPGLIEIIGADEALIDMINRNKLHNDLNGISRSELNFEMYDDQDKLFSNGVFPNK